MLPFNQSFYDKYQIKITEDAIENNEYPLELQRAMENIKYALDDRDMEGMVSIIKSWIKGYPKTPELYNLLSNAYSIEGNYKKSDKVIREMVRKFPDYMFSKIQMAHIHIRNDESEKALAILKSPKRMLRYRIRGYLHISQFLAWMVTLGIAHSDYGNEEEARDCLRMLLDYGDWDLPQIKYLGNKINRNKFKLGKGADFYDNTPPVIPHFKITPTDEKPVFHHPETEWLYQFSNEGFPVEKIDALMALPPESFKEDLEKVVLDSLARYAWYYDNYDAFVEEEQSFLPNALNFLMFLGDEKSMEIVWDVIARDDDFIEYWLADQGPEYFTPLFYHLGNKRIDRLVELIKQPNVDTWVKAYVSNAIGNIIVYQPERNKEVEGCFSQLFNFFLDEEDENIFDTTLMNLIMSEAVSLRMKTLLPFIEEMEEMKVFDPMIRGTLEEIKNEIDKPPFKSIDRCVPLDIYQAFDGSYLEIVDKAEPKKLLEKLDEEEKDDVDKYLSELFIDSIRNYFSEEI